MSLMIEAAAQKAPPPRPHVAVQERNSVPGKRKLRALIVEDEFIVALAIEDALRAAGVEIVGVAACADDALRLAEEEAPDFATMDISLVGPEGGVSIALKLRQRFEIGSLFITAFSDEEQKQAAAAARPLGWVAKPFSPSQLAGVIAAVQRELAT